MLFIRFDGNAASQHQNDVTEAATVDLSCTSILLDPESESW